MAEFKGIWMPDNAPECEPIREVVKGHFLELTITTDGHYRFSFDDEIILVICPFYMEAIVSETVGR